MMKKSIFEFYDYKRYLEAKIQAMPAGGRGVRAKLAEDLGCQASFISQVLRGDLHFSGEQAVQVAKFFHLDPEEKDFFLLLNSFGRAGSHDLRQHYGAQMELIRTQRNELKNRIQSSGEIPFEDRERYYSSSLYQILHVLCDIPGLQTKEAMAHAAKISVSTVAEALRFLVNVGLIEENAGKYRSGKQKIYLDKDSVLVNKLHYNWRLEALNSLKERKPIDMHFSATLSVSEKHASELRRLLLDYIERMGEISNDTQPEHAIALCLDIFAI